MLTVEQVSKQFEHSPSPLLNAIDFRLNAGESLAIMGASGSGKSTLLNMIAGLVPCTGGRISVHPAHGQPSIISQLKESDRDAFRARHMGMVFQQFNLIDCLSVEDNISLPARYLGLSYRDHLADLLLALQIDHIKHADISQLSGGEQQRVAIARALIHAPSLILADEPTGNLDEKTSQAVSELLFSLVNPSMPHLWS